MMNRMKAFEIRINDATPMIVAADNHVIADFTYGVSAINPNSAVIAGFDDFYRYVWLDEEIHHNDEVHIRVVEVDKEKISVPLKTTKESLERLKEHPIKRVPCKLVCKWPNVNILSNKECFSCRYRQKVVSLQRKIS